MAGLSLGGDEEGTAGSGGDGLLPLCVLPRPSLWVVQETGSPEAGVTPSPSSTHLFEKLLCGKGTRLVPEGPLETALEVAPTTLESSLLFLEKLKCKCPDRPSSSEVPSPSQPCLCLHCHLAAVTFCLLPLSLSHPTKLLPCQGRRRSREGWEVPLLLSKSQPLAVKLVRTGNEGGRSTMGK